jgi:hypothetical protein
MKVASVAAKCQCGWFAAAVCFEGASSNRLWAYNVEKPFPAFSNRNIRKPSGITTTTQQQHDEEKNFAPFSLLKPDANHDPIACKAITVPPMPYNQAGSQQSRHVHRSNALNQ